MTTRFGRSLAAGCSSSGGTGTTAEFIALSERIAGAQLDDLFNAWLYTGSKPALEPAMLAINATAEPTQHDRGGKRPGVGGALPRASRERLVLTTKLGGGPASEVQKGHVKRLVTVVAVMVAQ